MLEGLREHFGFIDQSLNPDLKDIEVSFIASGHNFFVADQNGQIVGTVGLLYESGRARIVRMSVLKEYRKSGIASVLLATCIEAAKAEGFAEIVAFTSRLAHLQRTGQMTFHTRLRVTRRVFRFLGDLPKTYAGTGFLGVETSTLDAEGEVVSRSDASGVLRTTRPLC